MMSGIVLGRDLFNLYREGDKPDPGAASNMVENLRRTGLDFNGKPNDGVAEYRFFFCVPPERTWVGRIKIAHDFLYVTVPTYTAINRIPLDELQLYEDSAFADRLWLKKTGRDIRPYTFNGPGGQFRDLYPFLHTPPLYKIEENAVPAPHFLDNHDFCALDDPRWVRAFCLHKGTMIGIDLHWQRNDKKFPPKGEKNLGDGRRNIRGVKSKFEGDFTAYHVWKAYYFLTDAGTMFMLPDDPETTSMTEVWGDPKRRLLGCIQDVDGKTVYAIVRGEGGKRQWFELSPKPELHDYERTAESLKTHPRRDEIPDAWNAIREYRKKAMQSEK